ncbi:hypothetical protein JCM10450v2_002818 [Rhodotorula kratochvilovae]
MPPRALTTALRTLARPSCAAPLAPRLLPTSRLARALSTSAARASVKDYASAFLHGSEEAKEQAKEQHSKLVGRHPTRAGQEGRDWTVGIDHWRFVHELQKHKVLPQHVEQYKKLIEGYYRGIHESNEFDARLTGSWEIVVGDVDTFVHIWEYQGLGGFEHTKMAIRESRGHLQFFNHEILPLINSRTSQLCTEFKFFPVTEPQERGGIYELRTYDLKPGALLEWENERGGLEARVAAGHTPVACWYAGIGKLHTVHMIWHYESLEARREIRAASWRNDKWSNTVTRTVPLTQSMASNILRALPYSPMR